MFMQASKLSLSLAEGKCVVELLFVVPHIFRLRKLHKSKLCIYIRNGKLFISTVKSSGIIQWMSLSLELDVGMKIGKLN